MGDHLYVCLQDEDKIVGFAIDAGAGGLTRRAEVPVPGGRCWRSALTGGSSMSAIARSRRYRAF